MSANKYANLPDIDTAPDVYETEDVFPSAGENKGDSSDDETTAPARSNARGKNGDVPSKEELDMSSLMDTDEASKKFKRAEKRRHRPRIQYTYPPSPTELSDDNSPLPSTPALPLSHRLRKLQTELAALETELADPSNPLLHKEREEGHVDPGELIRGMVDVKGRLEKITKLKEGRTKLVVAVLGDKGADAGSKKNGEKGAEAGDESGSEEEDVAETKARGGVKDIAEMDRRVGELEKVVGSSSTALDEMTPLPPPLLPLLTRLNTQLTLLTQPRHIDSISRRLKLLLSDLDRVSSSHAHHSAAQRKSTTHQPSSSASARPASPTTTGPATPSPLQEQLTPILTRLAPLLPHIPHILTRLRTLSTLHTSAASFQSTMEGLEEEQRRVRAALEELGKAVEGVEKSLNDNEAVVKNNVKDLEERVDAVGQRVEELKIRTD